MRVMQGVIAGGKRMLSALLALTLFCASAIVPVPVAYAADPVSETYSWDTRTDFETNASTTGQAVALVGLSTTDRPGSVALEDLDSGTIVAVSAGDSATVGLKSDGTVVAVGDNYDGQLDVSTWADVVAVAAGGDHTVGLKSDGALVAVGSNTFGQCNLYWPSGLGGTPSVRSGNIGGAGLTGLRARYSIVNGYTTAWSELTAKHAPLAPGESIKIAVRVSEDGVSWSQPLGRDGKRIDWTDATGNYFGSAYGDFAWHKSLSVIPAKPYVDLEVRLISDSGSGPVLDSLALTISRTKDTTTPAAPSGLSATVLSESAVRLSWDDASGIKEYRVYVDGDLEKTTTDTSWTVTGLTPSTAYSFNVVAVDGADNASPPSITVSATTQSKETDPFTAVPVQGAGRVETAIEASKLAFPDGAETVVISTGYNWPDALGGSALAGALDAPILLTESGSLPASVVTEVGRLEAARAVILGGTGAVSSAVEASLKSLLGKDNVERISGDDRYLTAGAIADATIEANPDWDGTAFVATGKDFPDALGASPLAASGGWPIFLDEPGTASDAALVSKMREAGVDEVIVLGGTGVVPTGLENALKTAFGQDAVKRLYGQDRYETAAAVAAYGVTDAGLSWDGVAIATGQNFPDALGGGVLQGKDGSVLLLTPSASLHASVRSALEHNASTISQVRFLGGVGAVTPGVRTEVTRILE